MDARSGNIRTLVVRALILLAVGASTATARPSARDEVYRHPDLEGHRGMTVAILPAVAIVGDERVERLVERAWSTLYQGSDTRWMPAGEVRVRLAEVVGDPAALIAEVRSQIWHDGTVRPTTARVLAGLLGVDAVLSVRVDRLEVEEDGRGLAGMTASILGVDGARLWSITGTQVHGATAVNHSIEGEQSMMLGGASENDAGAALLSLFGRWAWQIPSPLYGDAIEPMQLAQNGRK
jgi:hypothetical protein